MLIFSNTLTYKKKFYFNKKSISSKQLIDSLILEIRTKSRTGIEYFKEIQRLWFVDHFSVCDRLNYETVKEGRNSVVSEIKKLCLEEEKVKIGAGARPIQKGNY